MKFNDLHSSRAGLHFVTAAVLAGGVFLGSLAGTGDFGTLTWVIICITLVIYPATLQPFTWIGALMWAFLDLIHMGFGFKIGNTEASLVFGALLIGTTWWRKIQLEPPEFSTHWSYRATKILLFIWLAYMLSHTVFNVLNPYSPQDYSFKSLIKTALQWIAPSALLFCFFNWPPLVFRFGSNLPRTMAWILFWAVFVNILLRSYFLWSGQNGISSGTDDAVYGVYIPYLELAENSYSLRFLGPFGILFYTVLITSEWFSKQTALTRALCWSSIGFCLFGAVLSGGRFTMAVGVAQAAVVLVVRKKSWMLFTAAVPAAIVFLAVNLFSTEIREAPFMVNRSLQWMLIKKDINTVGDISSSTEWRKEIFLRALDEWRSNGRIFWFGRATYSFTDADQIGYKLRAGEGAMESGLRRGATHNFLTDLLVIFGLTGAILCLSLNVAIGFFLLKLWRIPNQISATKDLALICLIFHIVNVGIGVVGGGTMPPAFAWLLIIIVTMHYFQNEQAAQLARPRLRGFGASRGNGTLQPAVRAGRASKINAPRR